MKKIFVSAFLSALFMLSAFADDPVVALEQYRWISAPTILKTSRITNAAGTRCRDADSFELCVGPATATPATSGASPVVTMIKCFIPANTYQCPTTISAQNACDFADAEGNKTPPTPACTEDRQYDGFPGGCLCTNFGDRRGKGTAAQCRQARDQRHAREVARACCTGTHQGTSCTMTSQCTIYCRTYANNPTVAAACPSPRVEEPSTEPAPAPAAPSAPEPAPAEQYAGATDGQYPVCIAVPILPESETELVDLSQAQSCGE